MFQVKVNRNGKLVLLRGTFATIADAKAACKNAVSIHYARTGQLAHRLPARRPVVTYLNTGWS